MSLIETEMDKTNNIKKFIYFNPHDKKIKLKTDNGGWWSDITWEIRDEHENIILIAPSIIINNVTNYCGEIDKDYFINGRTYKIILKTLCDDDIMIFKIWLVN